MSKLVVYRASAGSGKTYRLAVEYLKQVISNPESYKNILAVTFTNKATAEMKGRILDELFSIAQGSKTSMADEISHTLLFTETQLADRAQQALSLILHDYSQFSVSTIDSFVQRVIQALLWEIGEQGGVEIKLDIEPVLEQAAENLIDSACYIDELMHWITRMGESLMDEGKSWDVKNRLVELGKQLFSESFRLMDKDEINRFTDLKNVEILKKSLHQIVKDIIAKLNEISKKALKELEKVGLTSQNFAYANSGVINFFNKCATIDDSHSQLPNIDGVRVQNALKDPTGENWVNKSTFNNKVEFLPIEMIVSEVLHPTLVIIADYINKNATSYITAKLVLKNLENLALLGDLWVKIRELSKEEGFLLLNDSNHLLREFVGDSDAPFIYEKVGTRYDVFMIDEFQDTSVMQWYNFKPLIENSLSQGFFSMIVGDVKQSIYRWRNGDWKILATEVEKDFAYHGIEERFLNINRRSLPAVVNFNNQFFKTAINLISNQIEIDENSDGIKSTTCFSKLARSAYKDIIQNPLKADEDYDGKVKINFIVEKNSEGYSDTLAKELPALIERLKNYYNPGDIAILVRKNNEGQSIANMLLNHNRAINDPNNHIKFISQEGLLLKASSVVRLIISAFRLVENPQNDVAKRVLSKELNTINSQDNVSWHQCFVDNKFIEEEIAWLSSLNTRPLQEAFEAVAHRYGLHSHSQELAYLSELQEYILTLSGKGGSDVGQFLSWWDENACKLSLSVPETTDAITILTIHKAKGLQFPVVIIPFANWPFRVGNKTPLLWVSTEEKPFNILPRYPIFSSSLAQKSLFAPEALEEKMKELIDNLNLLYVAFTRPKNELYVYSSFPESNKGNGEGITLNNASKLLWQVLPQINSEQIDCMNEANKPIIFQFSFGNSTAKVLSQKSSKETDLTHWVIKSYLTGNDHGILKLRMEAREFFLSFPTEKFQHREHGKVMHEVFAQIETADDIDYALHKISNDGLIGIEEKESLAKKIKQLLKNEPMKSWFSGKWHVKTETTILTPKGYSYRPDRVMVKDSSAIVVDFKFGTVSDSHAIQVNRYANLLRDMGYAKTEGYIWYVDINQLVKL